MLMDEVIVWSDILASNRPMDQLWAAVLCMEGPALSWYCWSRGRDPFRSLEGLKRRLLERLHHAMKLSISIDENKACKNVLWGGGLHRSTIMQTTSNGENFRRLTDSELQAMRAKGLCYRCDKKFTRGHRCPSQTLQVLLVDESDGSDDEVAPEVQVKQWDPETNIN
nr:ankyrin repeat-containing protein [Tanacetum cinerariifolium]